MNLVAFVTDRRRRDGKLSIKKVTMRRSAGVPKLHEERCLIMLVNRVDDLLSSLALRIGPNAGCVIPTDGFLGNERAFGDDHSR